MEFIRKIIEVYNLYKSGKLDLILADVNQMQYKKNQIQNQLGALEQDVKLSKQRRGT